MDARGYCRIEGRLKDMIIRGGENIYPREIEAVLLSHPAVTAAAVVGIPDRFWGEIVGAAITTSATTPAAGDELAGFCRTRLAAYKVPVRWLFTGDFPLTATGKIRKDALRAQFAGAAAGIAVQGRAGIPRSARACGACSGRRGCARWA
jgi:acyl-CoA synthetase (AMP-forming)/AMP-acid ligase II